MQLSNENVSTTFVSIIEVWTKYLKYTDFIFYLFIKYNKG